MYIYVLVSILPPVFIKNSGCPRSGINRALLSYLHWQFLHVVFFIKHPQVRVTFTSEIFSNGNTKVQIVSNLLLQVKVQRLFLSIQQSCYTGQELMAAASRFEFQDKEPQAEHGSHLLQLTGTKL